MESPLRRLIGLNGGYRVQVPGMVISMPCLWTFGVARRPERPGLGQGRGRDGTVASLEGALAWILLMSWLKDERLVGWVASCLRRRFGSFSLTAILRREDGRMFA